MMKGRSKGLRSSRKDSSPRGLYEQGEHDKRRVKLAIFVVGVLLTVRACTQLLVHVFICYLLVHVFLCYAHACTHVGGWVSVSPLTFTLREHCYRLVSCPTT